jgi:exodeoxyribonuclease V alpha subunit
MISLVGHLERITYFNAQNHYTVAQFITAKTHNKITIVGNLPAPSPGQTMRIKGEWQDHPKFGQQFKIKFFETELPASVEGIRKYLASGLIKGIGPMIADRLVAHFGPHALEIIENNPEKLVAVEGIGKAKAALIGDAWRNHHAMGSLMHFLQEMGIKTGYCAKIYQQYGAASMDIIRTDPYRLTKDIPGIDFYIADTLARKMGLSEDMPTRIRECIFFVLHQHVNEGHTFIYENHLLDRCETLFQIECGTIQQLLEKLAASGELVVEVLVDDPGSRAIYLKSLHQAECGLANRLKALLSVPIVPDAIETDHIEREVQKRLAIQLSAEQVHVLEQVLSHRAIILTGGPGTGKTTLIKSICILYARLGKKVLLAAPTGRAARRLSEVSGRNAKTIHRLLAYNYNDDRFGKNQDNPLDADAVIIDEASMVDTFLMFRLLNAVPMTSSLILVGDIFQLPSVGPGDVLADIIESVKIPVFYLKQIFRQAQESPIVLNAHRIRRGKMPILEKLDESGTNAEFYFLEQNDPEVVVATIVDLCTRIVPQYYHLDPVNEIQVLAPMHKGVVGTIHLNQVLQKVLNPSPFIPDTAVNSFKIDDKVMHLKNNYQKDVFNGDIGTIRSIDRKNGQLLISYYGREVAYDFSEMDQIALAYAISIHKAQGGEYPAVVVPLMPQHFVLLQRNLLYTAITRGKNLVVLTGTKRALRIALKNDNPRKRLTRLASRLVENGQ